MAGGADQQAESHVGGGIGEDPGRVADGDAAGRRRRDVDVVETHGIVADDLEPRGGVEQGRVDLVGEQRHQPVTIGDFAAEQIIGGRHLLGPNLGITMRLDRLEPRIGNDAGNEDSRFRGHGKKSR